LPLELDHPGRHVGTDAGTATLVPHDDGCVVDRLLSRIFPRDIGEQPGWSLEPIIRFLRRIACRRSLGEVLVEGDELLARRVSGIERHEAL
jgi:hypothetical protein